MARGLVALRSMAFGLMTLGCSASTIDESNAIESVDARQDHLLETSAINGAVRSLSPTSSSVQPIAPGTPFVRESVRDLSDVYVDQRPQQTSYAWIATEQGQEYSVTMQREPLAANGPVTIINAYSSDGDHYAAQILEPHRSADGWVWGARFRNGHDGASVIRGLAFVDEQPANISAELDARSAPRSYAFPFDESGNPHRAIIARVQQLSAEHTELRAALWAILKTTERMEEEFAGSTVVLDDEFRFSGDERVYTTAWLGENCWGDCSVRTEPREKAKTVKFETTVGTVTAKFSGPEVEGSSTCYGTCAPVGGSTKSVTGGIKNAKDNEFCKKAMVKNNKISHAHVVSIDVSASLTNIPGCVPDRHDDSTSSGTLELSGTLFGVSASFKIGNLLPIKKTWGKDIRAGFRGTDVYCSEGPFGKKVMEKQEVKVIEAAEGTVSNPCVI